MRHPLGTCRACGLEHSALTKAGGGPTDPTGDTFPPGAATICVGCGELSLIEDGPYGLQLRAPTDQEFADLVADPGVQRARAALHEAWKEHGPAERWPAPDRPDHA